MKQKKGKLRSNLAFNIIAAVVLMLFLFGAVVSTHGYIRFTTAFKNEYSISTYHMADTATTLLNGDHLEAYLAGENTEEYLHSKEYLDAYCKKMSVSLVYVIAVDRSDYGRFVSVFNSVDNSVDDSKYTPWELGYKRDTTNDEYRTKYQRLYEKQSDYETIYRLQVKDGVHPHITTMVPVKNAKGDVTGLLCIQRPMRELLNAMRPYLWNVAASTLFSILCITVFLAVFFRRQFVAPIRKVSEEASRFARENTKGQELMGISRYTEIANLAASVDTMETDMVRYLENLTAVTAEKERIGAELSLASTIQENSVPNIFPAFPDRTDFDIYASMTPAKEVGGDFYNFFLIDEDHLAMAIGDVSGKGIPASLFMMVTNILISDRTHMGGTPGEILTFVNENLCAHNKAEMFVTVWLGILELSTGRLTAANAGHEYPALKSPDGGFALLKDKHGFVLGGMAGMRYQEYEMILEPGAKLFVYTDGVPEATDGAQKMFGAERMLAALNQTPDASPERILRDVKQNVDAFVKDAEQFDDLTMLCVEYKGGRSSDKSSEKEKNK